MKRFINGLAVLLVALFVTTGVSFAKTTKKKVTFIKAVSVNGTLVKKGTYNVKFDDTNNELSILDGNKVLAKAEARIEKQAIKSMYTTLESGDVKKPDTLVSVGMKDGNQATILDASTTGQ